MPSTPVQPFPVRSGLPVRPPRLTERKRLAIIEAAIGEFRARGFDATSMDQIAARAAVSKRTVYNHFPSKDELFTEILLQLWRQSAAAPAITYVAGQPLRPQLLAIVEQKMGLLGEGSFIDLARVALAATIHAPERGSNMVARLNEKDVGVPAWIAAAQHDGRLKPADPAFAAQLLFAPLKTFAFWPQVTLGQAALDADRQQQVNAAAVDMFLAYYAVDHQRSHDDDHPVTT
jgi:TetR/AcrR family transcriptional regulator of autoinduction and epiphytic fitness